MKRRGFTLVELLVVLSVIALLVAILVPTFDAARAQVRSTICQNNLRLVGQTFTTAKAATQASGPVMMVFPISNDWPYKTMRNLTNHDMFKCPVDPKAATGKVDIMAEIGTRVEYRSTYRGGIAIPLVGIVVNNYVLSREGRDFTEYVFEEAGNINQNFWKPGNHNDGWIRIYHDGRVEIVDCNCGGDNQLWIDNKPAFGTDPKNPACTQMKQNKGKVLQTDLYRSGPCSYGINSYAFKYPYGSKVIVLLDYQDRVADPDTEDLAQTRDVLQKSGRHSGRINLLTTDCAVGTKTYQELDPVTGWVHWNPSRFTDDGRP